jgi:hypothetical protein
MAQHDRVNLLRVEWQNFIERLRFLAMALEQTALEQQFFAVDLDEIHRTGGGARRAEEVDFHWPKETAPAPLRQTESRAAIWGWEEKFELLFDVVLEQRRAKPGGFGNWLELPG